VDFFSLKKAHHTQLNFIVNKAESKMAIETFTDVKTIFDRWVEFRLKWYEVRRQTRIKEIQAAIPMAEYRVKFIQLVVNGTLKLGKREQNFAETLLSNGIPENLHSQFLRMSLSSFSEERIADICKELEDLRQRLTFYETTSDKQLWLTDLDMLLKALPEFWKSRSEEN
jgi:DNA gyrase/topoisomerase IV subunit A